MRADARANSAASAAAASSSDILFGASGEETGDVEPEVWRGDEDEEGEEDDEDEEEEEEEEEEEGSGCSSCSFFSSPVSIDFSAPFSTTVSFPMPSPCSTACALKTRCLMVWCGVLLCVMV
jgi:hypothetical protein